VGGIQGGPQGQPPGGGLGQTESERVGALDRELAESLEGFEVAMAGEQVRVAEKNADQRGSSSGGGADVPGGGYGGGSDYPSDMGGGGEFPSERQSPSAGDSSRPSNTAGPGGEGGSTPPDVGDGSDDDIVARQLREAAQNETDPELREKLWDEYRAYKNSTGR
jgi:hypothetical protein